MTAGERARGIWWSCGLGAALVIGFSGLSACAAHKPVAPREAAYQPTPVPTVPPGTPPPQAAGTPLPTRGIRKAVKARPGQPIGPVVTFFGAARADGTMVKPESAKHGISTYLTSVGSGFILVVEAKPGPSGLDVGKSVFSYVADDPKQQPDLQIESNRNLGDGSRAVCDKRLPNIGGIPGIPRPSFAPRQRISDALNDFACRFETFVESGSSCTKEANGDYSFVKPDTTTQFCMIVARAWAFPVGDTMLTVRLLDTEGNPGPIEHVRFHRPPPRKKPAVRTKR
jgi:hypothetical protein